MSENNKSSQSHKKIKFKKPKKTTITVTLICACIVLGALSAFLFFDTINAGSESLKNAYLTNYYSEKESTYKEIYDYFYDYAENEYHVSNRAAIYVGDLKEQEKLEVLKVSDVEFIIEEKTDNSSNMISWLEVPGEGTFVVDLQAGEYIIDNARSYILVRVPYPELTNVKIDYANVEKLLFKDDWFNGNYSEGESLAQKQLEKAELLIKKEFLSNQNFYLNAQDAARSSIINLVKQLNPNVENLNVEVEFY